MPATLQQCDLDQPHYYERQPLSRALYQQAGRSQTPFPFIEIQFPDLANGQVPPPVDARRKALRQFAVEEFSETVSLALSNAGYVADRKGFTADGSILFEFLSDPQIGIDVYPTGELIVLIRTDSVNHVHELDSSHLDEMVALLRDARPS